MRKIFDKFERIDPFIKMAMECLAIFIALCVLMQVVLYEAIIPSGSMYPTIAYPSLNFGYRLAYKNSEPQRGDMPYGSLCDECSKRLNEQVHGKYETPWQKVEQGREERSTPWWFDL